jgi:hypothetical protein
MDASKTTTSPRRGLLTVSFFDINEPGVYVTRRGDLFRVSPEALASHCPILPWENLDCSVGMRISEDPYTPISKCRQLAADADLPVNF